MIEFRRTGLFLKLWGKDLSFEKGYSKIFYRIYVLGEHNPKAASAIAAFFVFLGEMSGCRHVGFLSGKFCTNRHCFLSIALPLPHPGL